MLASSGEMRLQAGGEGVGRVVVAVRRGGCTPCAETTCELLSVHDLDSILYTSRHTTTHLQYTYISSVPSPREMCVSCVARAPVLRDAWVDYTIPVYIYIYSII